jgi:hypothetical protein
MKLRRRSLKSKLDGPGPDWDRLADGRIWRLRRGRDFDCSPKQFVRELDAIASRLGKVARGVVDRMAPEDYVWVQFAEFLAKPGEPCTCGGTRFRRIHAHFGRCETCGTQVMLPDPGSRSDLDADLADDDEFDFDEPDLPLSPRQPETRAAAEYSQAMAGSVLAAFPKVRLSLADEGDEYRRYFGYGIAPSGQPMLLLVTVSLVGGSPISDPASPLGVACEVRSLDLEPFGRLIDRSQLHEGAWDIELP